MRKIVFRWWISRIMSELIAMIVGTFTGVLCYDWFDSADDLHVGRRIIWDFANHTALDIVIVLSIAQYYFCGKPGQIAADSGLWFP